MLWRFERLEQARPHRNRILSFKRLTVYSSHLPASAGGSTEMLQAPGPWDTPSAESMVGAGLEAGKALSWAFQKEPG